MCRRKISLALFAGIALTGCNGNTKIVDGRGQQEYSLPGDADYFPFDARDWETKLGQKPEDANKIQLYLFGNLELVSSVTEEQRSGEFQNGNTSTEIEKTTVNKKLSIDHMTPAVLIKLQGIEPQKRGPYEFYKEVPFDIPKRSWDSKEPHVYDAVDLGGIAFQYISNGTIDLTNWDKNEPADFGLSFVDDLNSTASSLDVHGGPHSYPQHFYVQDPNTKLWRSEHGNWKARDNFRFSFGSQFRPPFLIRKGATLSMKEKVIDGGD